jgi:hypothetical protein
MPQVWKSPGAAAPRERRAAKGTHFFVSIATSLTQRPAATVEDTREVDRRLAADQADDWCVPLALGALFAESVWAVHGRRRTIDSLTWQTANHTLVVPNHRPKDGVLNSIQEKETAT